MKNYSLVMRKLRKIDFFGKLLTFNENDSEKYHTFFGLFLSVVTIATCVVIGFLFGQEIYKRETPFVNSSLDFINPQESLVNLKDMPMFFNFVDMYGNAYSNPEDYFTFFIETVLTDENFNVQYMDPTFGLTPCKLDLFDEEHHQYLKDVFVEGNLFFCFEYKDTSQAKNIMGSPDAVLNILNFAKCNPNTKTCADDLDTILTDFYISFYYLESYFDQKNYKNSHQRYLNSKIFKASNGLYRRQNIKFQHHELITDKGWIIEDIQTESLITFESIITDVNFASEAEGIYKNLLLDLAFTSSLVKPIVSRNYLKVQELLARIGGFFNACLVIFTIISADYIEFSLFNS